MDDCLFCKIIAGEIPATKVFESEDVLAFRDINPQAPTHILIIPKEHIPTLNDLQPAHGSVLQSIFQAAVHLARQEGIDQSGYRTVFNCNRDSGQEVYHIHLHLLGGRKMTWPPG
ncbi:MAG: histidine triad nucleotide-binding protein [Candidatus Neomarinimicrobiota bacterium]|nr:MAG: histidine triad nucleotide-binding protein [Candidatus Neomarinimicrobiota bacterium]